MSGWSGFTNASTSSQLHYFTNEESDTKSICGMASLSNKKGIGKFVKDLTTYNEKKLCKKCKEKKGIMDLRL